jgi:hypothetical protein
LAKALHLLDRQDAVRGESILRGAIAAADATADSVTALTARCCFGELLVRQGRRREAAEVLQSCLAVMIPEHFDDVCAAERATAQQLLAGLA